MKHFDFDNISSVLATLAVLFMLFTDYPNQTHLLGAMFIAVIGKLASLREYARTRRN